jgi:hypothetical protein
MESGKPKTGNVRRARGIAPNMLHTSRAKQSSSWNLAPILWKRVYSAGYGESVHHTGTTNTPQK